MRLAWIIILIKYRELEFKIDSTVKSKWGLEKPLLPDLKWFQLNLNK